MIIKPKNTQGLKINENFLLTEKQQAKFRSMQISCLLFL